MASAVRACYGMSVIPGKLSGTGPSELKTRTAASGCDANGLAPSGANIMTSRFVSFLTQFATRRSTTKAATATSVSRAAARSGTCCPDSCAAMYAKHVTYSAIRHPMPVPAILAVNAVMTFGCGGIASSRRFWIPFAPTSFPRSA